MRKSITWSLSLFLLVITLLLVACGDVTSIAPSEPGKSSIATANATPAQTMVASSTTVATTPGTQSTPAATTMASVSMSDIAGMATPGNDPMTLMLKPLSGTVFEVNWMQMMIIHHQGAIDMAKLVKTNTKRPELTKLADEIVTAQTKEIDQMTKWLADWHNAKPLPAMAGMDHSGHGGLPTAAPASSMTMGMTDMSKLKAVKDAEFDQMFVAMMIEHHQQAVSMAALIPDKTKRAEFLGLGQAIIKAQTGEIEQMQNWQKTWAK